MDTQSELEKEIEGLQLRTLNANWRNGEMVFRLKDLVQFILQRESKVREEERDRVLRILGPYERDKWEKIVKQVLEES